MDLNTGLSLLGVLFGIGGVIVGLVSILRSRKVQDQMEKKEELNELAGVLQRINSSLNNTFSFISSPEDNIDFQPHMRALGTEAVAYHHKTGEKPTYEIRVYIWDGESIDIHDPKKFLDEVKHNRVPSV